jgi:hypothetical protein
MTPDEAVFSIQIYYYRLTIKGTPIFMPFDSDIRLTREQLKLVSDALLGVDIDQVSIQVWRVTITRDKISRQRIKNFDSNSHKFM